MCLILTCRFWAATLNITTSFVRSESPEVLLICLTMSCVQTLLIWPFGMSFSHITFLWLMRRLSAADLCITEFLSWSSVVTVSDAALLSLKSHRSWSGACRFCWGVSTGARLGAPVGSGTLPSLLDQRFWRNPQANKCLDRQSKSQSTYEREIPRLSKPR